MPGGAFRFAWAVFDLAELAHVKERIEAALIEPIERAAHGKAFALDALRGGGNGEQGTLERPDRTDVRNAGESQHVPGRHRRHSSSTNRVGLVGIPWIATGSHRLTSTAVRIGVMIEGQEGLTWDRWFRIADRVETLGLDSLWRSDHFFSLMGHPERPALECWSSLTALAQRRRRIRSGPLVSPMTFRHPALLARMAAAVDGLSNGRLSLGVGAGWNEAEHEAFGISLPPLKERFDRLEEGIAVIKALWTGGPVDIDGHYYRLRGAAALPRPVQRPAPPLLLGGAGEKRLLRIVAKAADEWNSHAPGPEAYRGKRARLEEHCREVGRDPDAIHRSWMGGIVIGRDAAEVAEKGRWMQSFLAALSGVAPTGALDELRRRHWLVGTADQVGSELDAWSAVGVERVMLQWYHLDDLDGLGLLAELNRGQR